MLVDVVENLGDRLGPHPGFVFVGECVETEGLVCDLIGVSVADSFDVFAKVVDAASEFVVPAETILGSA